MIRNMCRLALFVALLGWSGAVWSADVKVGELVLERPWTRATPGGAKVGAGYLSIINGGGEADRLLAASSDIAERVEIHTMTMESGVMRMRRLPDGLAIAPRAVTTLKPGGLHIMFIGLRQPIRKGDRIEVELTFEKAGKVSAVFAAQAIGAGAPKGSGAGPAGGSSSGAVKGSASHAKTGGSNAGN